MTAKPFETFEEMTKELERGEMFPAEFWSKFKERYTATAEQMELKIKSKTVKTTA